MLVTCPAHLIILYLIGEEENLYAFSLYKFMYNRLTFHFMNVESRNCSRECLRTRQAFPSIFTVLYSQSFQTEILF